MHDNLDIFCLGVNHTSAPLSFREALHVPQEDLRGLLPDLRRDCGLEELVVLSTCNRFELYAVLPHGEAANQLTAAFLQLQERARKSNLPTPGELADHAYFYRDAQAIEHIFHVGASLDSLVLGETQITGQFKDAWDLAKAATTLGPHLTRLGQDVLNTAKKVRSRTAIGRKTVSISHAAIDLAAQVFSDLSSQRFLFVGAGEMIRVAAHHAKSRGAQHMWFANRTQENALELACELGVGEARPLTDLPVLLREADIVISGATVAHTLISAEDLRAAMVQRRGRSLFLVDIALPRNIDPAASAIEDVYLFELDDLRRVVDDNMRERQAALSAARALITQGMQQFLNWRAQIFVKPTLGNFRRYVDALLQREAERTFGRQLFAELSPHQTQAIGQFLESVAAKITGDLARALKDGKFEKDDTGRE